MKRVKLYQGSKTINVYPIDVSGWVNAGWSKEPTISPTKDIVVETDVVEEPTTKSTNNVKKRGRKPKTQKVEG